MNSKFLLFLIAFLLVSASQGRRIRRRVRRHRYLLHHRLRYLTIRLYFGDESKKMNDEYNLHLKTILSDISNDIGSDNAAKVISDLNTLINQHNIEDADVASIQAVKPDSDEAEKDEDRNDEDLDDKNINEEEIAELLKDLKNKNQIVQ